MRLPDGQLGWWQPGAGGSRGRGTWEAAVWWKRGARSAGKPITGQGFGRTWEGRSRLTPRRGKDCSPVQGDEGNLVWGREKTSALHTLNPNGTGG